MLFFSTTALELISIKPINHLKPLDLMHFPNLIFIVFIYYNAKTSVQYIIFLLFD